MLQGFMSTKQFSLNSVSVRAECLGYFTFFFNPLLKECHSCSANTEPWMCLQVYPKPSAHTSDHFLGTLAHSTYCTEQDRSTQQVFEYTLVNILHLQNLNLIYNKYFICSIVQIVHWVIKPVNKHNMWPRYVKCGCSPRWSTCASTCCYTEHFSDNSSLRRDYCSTGCLSTPLWDTEIYWPQVELTTRAFCMIIVQPPESFHHDKLDVVQKEKKQVREINWVTVNNYECKFFLQQGSLVATSSWSNLVQHWV